MSTSTGAFGVAVQGRKKSSRQIIPQNLLGGVAIAAVVLGCAWTVYTNVFGASIYPSMNSAAFEAPLVKNTTIVVARPARPTFNEVFASLPQQVAKVSPAEPAASSIMFNERFAAAAPQAVTLQPSERAPATQLAAAAPAASTPKAEAAKTEAPKLAEAPKTKDAPQQVALNVQSPPPAKPVEPKLAETKAPPKTGASVRDMAQRAKAAVMSIASNEKPTMVEKLWGKQSSQGSLLSYASADASITGSIPDTLSQNPMLGGAPPYDKQTAVYDISAKMVYLPDGTKLEAHSGLGAKLDDVRYSHVRMQGVTPPHIYTLKPREALFHGVPALRLTPVGGSEKIFNRDGLLAHTYMLGGRGDSNGCVSFKDYYAFLNAYKNQGIRRLAVLARIE